MDEDDIPPLQPLSNKEPSRLHPPAAPTNPPTPNDFTEAFPYSQKVAAPKCLSNGMVHFCLSIVMNFR